MKNALQRFGYTCVAAMIAAGITGTVLVQNMQAQPLNLISVTLPQDVTIGSSVLPAGNYTIQDIDPASGNHLFVFRGENKTVVVPGATVESLESAKTAVVLTRTGSAARLDKLVIEGSSIGYDFAGSTSARN